MDDDRLTPTEACPLCSKAVFDLDVDANVELHRHLDEFPDHKASFDERARIWGNATWTGNMSGAA